MMYCFIFFYLIHFRSLWQKSYYRFVQFLVQMSTRNFAHSRTLCTMTLIACYDKSLSPKLNKKRTNIGPISFIFAVLCNDFFCYLFFCYSPNIFQVKRNLARRRTIREIPGLTFLFHAMNYLESNSYRS